MMNRLAFGALIVAFIVGAFWLAVASFTFWVISLIGGWVILTAVTVFFALVVSRSVHPLIVGAIAVAGSAAFLSGLLGVHPVTFYIGLGLWAAAIVTAASTNREAL